MGSAEMSDAEFELGLLRPVMRHIARFSQAGAIAFVCSDWRAYPRMLDAAAGVFSEQKNLIIWAKTQAGMGTFYRSQTELIPVFKVSRGPTINNFELGQGGRHRSNLWTYPGANTFRRGRMDDLNAHPTVKNRQLVADALIDCSQPGGVVLDPFLGSGTTLAAAHVTGRRGYGLELDPKYCDVILRRMEALTGEPPSLLDGTPFEQVARKREAAAAAAGGGF
jgi:DNA modification methylase